MKSKTYLSIMSVVQVIAIATFLNYAWQADKAMDKTGIGDLALSQKYNSYAGIAFNLAVALWLVSILLAVFGKCFKESYSQIAIGLPPLLMVLGWLSLWFI